MLHNGFNYWLTKHGRARFIQRFGQKSDQDILATAINGYPGYIFIWAPDCRNPTTGRRLVTVLLDFEQWNPSQSLTYLKGAQ
jgi:hypothetical protein